MNSRSTIVTDTRDWTNKLEQLEPSALIVLTDENTSNKCLPYFQKEYLEARAFTEVQVPAGEQNKNLHHVEFIWDQLLAAEADRDAVLISLGGGLITDLGGFAASTYKRGIHVINVPTTNLAMTDAAIGGKTGINLHHVKNQVGTFHQPTMVLIDPAFLNSLSERELKSGFAETVKHALIADPSLWKRIRNADWKALCADIQVILKSAELKQSIAENDIHDRGLRQALNFGHTVGHAIEAEAHRLEINMLHGEAVFIGMLAEVYLSQQMGLLDQQQHDEITRYLVENTTLNGAFHPEIKSCIDFASKDKKNSNGEIRCSLIANIGEPMIGVVVSEKLLAEAIEYAMHQLRT